MTTPNIEELIKQLRALGIPDWKTARWMMTEAADALQSQAERIKELERESETHAKAYGLAIVERDNLRAQLAESVSNHEACKSANSMLLETIAEIEKQEPVGYAYANQDFIGSVIGAKGEWAPREIALFTRPMPAQDVTELVEALEQMIACHDEPTCPAIDVARSALSKYKGAK